MNRKRISFPSVSIHHYKRAWYHRGGRPEKEPHSLGDRQPGHLYRQPHQITS